MPENRTTDERVSAPADLRRHLGSHDAGVPGPLVLCVAGIHGNETAGIPATRRVLAELTERRPPFRGRFTALAGNLAALRRGVRYVDRDLNRHWLPERVRSITEAGVQDGAPVEDRELRELLTALEGEMARRGDEPAFFLDLHSSSAGGPPFLTVGDTLRNRRFAQELGLPLVLGLEEQIDGALLEYVNNHGHVTVGVEGGQHEAPEAVDRHEAVLWLALIAAGNLDAEDVPRRDALRRLLAEATPGAPPVIEVRHRHIVRPGDGFRMRPGYQNFDTVDREEALAEDHTGILRAPEGGRILLPLYQGQGNDGFFTVRDVHPFWLRLSGYLRRRRVPRLAALLPGVRRHPFDDDTLLVDTRVARFFPLQVFHLLGFRKRRWQGNLLLVSRRKYDRL